MKIWDLVIVGAGASGLFLGAHAQKSALILESSQRPGRKLAISGGGKANFSNRRIAAGNYLCRENRNFCETALKRFPVSSATEFVERLHLEWEEKSQGRLFLKHDASILRDRLVALAKTSGCKILENASARYVEKTEKGFLVSHAQGVALGKKLALACGSRARENAAKYCWNLAKQLGHSIQDPIPALTPLLWSEPLPGNPDSSSLAGVSARVASRLKSDPEKIWHDAILFTHSGLSGPAILNPTLRWESGDELLIDFLPDLNFEAILDQPQNDKKTPRSCLRSHLPRRLADALLPPELACRKNAEISRKNRKFLASLTHDFAIANASLAGFGRCEVCRGGVNTEELDPATMESRIASNLYVLGEMQNVTGELGGYNLHWAFASAWAAAQKIWES